MHESLLCLGKIKGQGEYLRRARTARYFYARFTPGAGLGWSPTYVEDGVEKWGGGGSIVGWDMCNVPFSLMGGNGVGSC